MNVISAPPRNLLQLAEALEKVDNKKIFFGRNLYLLTKQTDMPLEVIQGNVMNLFLEFINHIEYSPQSKTELEKVTLAYSNYSIRMKEIGLSAELKHLLNCGQKLIDSEAKRFDKHTTQVQDRLQMLLITDRDDDEGPGAMAVRTAQAISQRIPIVLPYSLLLSVMQAHFIRDTLEKAYYEQVRIVVRELSNSFQCNIYKHNHCDLVAVIPSGCQQTLNLSEYSLKDFKAFERQAILHYVVEPYKDRNFTSGDIIQTLSSEVSKHILWSGHGLLNKVTMGLSLIEAIQILNQTKHVACWDLTSCYLLGNIRQLVHKIDNLDLPIILIRNGMVSESSPLEDDESVRAYFSLSNKAFGKSDEKVKRYFSKASPWIAGLNIRNHPHIVLKDKRVVPLEIPELAAVLKDTYYEPKKYENIKRLYIATVLSKTPLFLSGKIALLPGLAETNTQHLLQDVKTNLSLSEFFASAFLYHDHLPGIRKIKNREKNSTHQGNYLLMIKKLECSDGIFPGIIHFKPQIGNNMQLVSREGRWCAYDPEPKPHFLGFGINFSEYVTPMEEILYNALIESCPSSQTWKQQSLTPASFYEAVASSFNLPESWTNEVNYQIRPLNKIPEPLLQKNEFIKIDTISPTPYICTSKLLRALTLFDVNKIHYLLNHNRKRGTLQSALFFCIDTNQIESFLHLLKYTTKGMTDPDLMYELIIRCIKMRRTELIKAFFKQLISLFNPDSYILKYAATRGDIAIFEAVCEKTNLQDVDFKELQNWAKEVNNWEIVHYINQKLAKQ